nr:hypothetical protein Itr_chr06CG17830 [Ipomoea trifida]GME05766.1 hypothetical protein Iba_scaffold3316CG0130 [Ipomoea batatas]
MLTKKQIASRKDDSHYPKLSRRTQSAASTVASRRTKPRRQKSVAAELRNRFTQVVAELRNIPSNQESETSLPLIELELPTTSAQTERSAGQLMPSFFVLRPLLYPSSSTASPNQHNRFSAAPVLRLYFRSSWLTRKRGRPVVCSPHNALVNWTNN